MKVQTDDLSDEKLTITVSGEGWDAVMHPDIDHPRHETPFGFRVAGDAPSTSEVAQRLYDEFKIQTQAAFDSL